MSQQRIKVGVQLVANAGVGVLATFTSDPKWAGLLGTVPVLADLLGDWAGKVLSRKEEGRVGLIGLHAFSAISERQARGDKLRQDGFFDCPPDGSIPAEEVFDGVLMAGKNDHEQKKQPFYGRLFCNIAFTESCSRSEANWLVSLLDRLTFRQLVLLYIVKHYKDLPLSSYLAPPPRREEWGREAAYAELLDLCRMNVIKREERHRFITSDVIEEDDPLDTQHLPLGSLRVLPLGKRLCAMADLDLLSAEDVQEVSDHFLK